MNEGHTLILYFIVFFSINACFFVFFVTRWFGIYDLTSHIASQFMGHMDLVSFVSKGLNIYYPMTILLVCLCTYFNIGSRILHCFGVQQFLIDEDLVAEYVNEGKDIVRRGELLSHIPVSSLNFCRFIVKSLAYPGG